MGAPAFSTTNRLVPAGGSVPIESTLGSQIKCMSSGAASGVITVQLGQNGRQCRFDQGDGYKMNAGETFTDYILYNSSGTDEIIQVGIALGEITTAQDVNIANEVKVINPTGVSLNVSDATAQADLATIAVDISAVKTDLETDGSVRPPLKNVGGSGAAAFATTSPIQLINPASNTNGAIIRTGNISTEGGGQSACYTGTVAPTSVTDTTNPCLAWVGASDQNADISGIKLPAGYGLWVVGGSGSGCAVITYDFL